MKYIILIGDGMADYPMGELGGKTLLQAAKTPNMDKLAKMGRCGQLITLQKGLPLGSDVANLSIFGYDAKKYYSGRGPLEAAAMGIKLGDDEIAFRCNLICVEEDKIKNHSGGHVTTEETKILIDDINKKFGDEDLKFYHGVSFRNLMTLNSERYSKDIECFAPHDFVGKKVNDVLIKATSEKGNETAEFLNKKIIESKEILENNPINVKRKKDGKDMANMIWPWSPGKKPKLETYQEKYGLKGAVISAVDLIKGIGVLAGFDVINVEGATGLYDTNYEGKADACIKALEDHDFIYLHVEAPDEAGHAGDLKLKIRTIEDFDKRIVGNIINRVDLKNTKIAALPDHYTPIKVKTHVEGPVPLILYDPNVKGDSISEYDEESVKKGSLGLIDNNKFIELFIKS